MNHPICRAALRAGSAIALTLSSQAFALSYCASDGQKAPVALVERFISADCEACWSQPDPVHAPRNALPIDWVVPGARGEDAPLSAVATTDAALRLQAVDGTLVHNQLGRVLTVSRQASLKLRVAHGLPVNDYIGTSIEARPGTALKRRVTAWLLLVETIPAGTEGTPVERNLVRNALQSSWNGAGLLSKSEQTRFFESRPMRLPEGARAERLRVVGWLQDESGRVLAAAASRCKAP